MSSPPPSATSPTTPGFSLPKKRPTLNIPSQNAKRRKPSSVSSTSHPLRQTSFPPEPTSQVATASSPARQASFSPSVDAASSVGGRGKGRKRKKERSTAPSGKDGDAPPSQPAGDGGQDNEPSDDEEGAEDAVLEGGGLMSEAAKKQEQKHLAMLMEAFTDEQMDRYATWRRVKLKKETVRKITNQTLSQSVPASVVTAINGFTKVFIGQLVEMARDVQVEWMVAKRLGPQQDEAESPNSGDKVNVNGTVGQSTSVNGSNVKVESPGATGASTVAPQDITQSTNEAKKSPSADVDPRSERSKLFDVEERDRGPLTPDHLREALRRYKKEREGGSAGFQGLSMLGRETTASRVGSKRLFR